MAIRSEPSERTRLRRRPQRGSYDPGVIYAILDAGVIAHLAYVVDGQPYCTPTAYWREGERVYWHGSAGSRMLQAQAAGIPVCLTVSHLDGFVLGRSGFTHSLLYRSVMALGRPEPVTDEAEKRRKMDAFIERLYPGRTREVRRAHDHELRAITILGMTLEEVSAKVRDGGALDPEPERSAPCWAGVVPIAATVGRSVPDPHLRPDAAISPSLSAYAERARLGDVLSASANPD